MEDSPRFEPSLAVRVLPPSLLQALRHVFAQRVSGCMLVGGTALAVGSSSLEREACGFAVDFGVSAAAVFRQVTAFQRELLTALDRHLSHAATSPLRDLIRRIKNL
ncbi:MAG: hypothetical protein OXC12_11650 [Spirochaetaceae bacterium]|nr:hypothetical protein [Spirochaetaceae bacterium]